MAVLGVTAAEGGLREATTGACPAAALAAQLGALPPGAPVVVLVHGFRFDPAAPRHDPHGLVLALDPVRAGRKVASWPRGLGFGRGDTGEGLCIGFGWRARAAHLPALVRSGRTGFAEVYARADAAGAALAALVVRIAALDPGRRVDVLAHSLGARVALSALPRLSPEAARAIGRLVLLGGAEFAGRAAGFVRGAAAEPEIVSVVSRQNDLYDALFERFAPRGPGADRALSAGLPGLRRAVTIQIDHPRVRAALHQRGIALAPPERAVCHWSFYTDPGAMAFHAAVLRDREAWPLEALREVAGLAAPEPRWSRLLPRREAGAALRLQGAGGV